MSKTLEDRIAALEKKAGCSECETGRKDITEAGSHLAWLKVCPYKAGWEASTADLKLDVAIDRLATHFKESGHS